MYKTVFIEIFDLRPVLKFLNLSWHLLGITVVQRGIVDNAYEKFWRGGRGANKVYQRRWQMNNFMSQEAYQNIHVVN